MTRLMWPLVGLGFLMVLMSANVAFAQSGHAGYTTTGVNMRTGPGTRYAVITTVPPGGVVFINYCTKNGTWCDLTFRGSPGWISAKYIRYGAEGPHYSRALPYVAPYVGLPFVYRRHQVYPRYPRWRPHSPRRYPPRRVPAYRLRPSDPIGVPAIPLRPSRPAAPRSIPATPLSPAR